MCVCIYIYITQCCKVCNLYFGRLLEERTIKAMHIYIYIYVCVHIAFMFGLLPLCLIIHICIYEDVQELGSHCLGFFPGSWNFNTGFGIF